MDDISEIFNEIKKSSSDSTIEHTGELIWNDVKDKSKMPFDQMEAISLNKHLSWLIFAVEPLMSDDGQTEGDRTISTRSVAETNEI